MSVSDAERLVRRARREARNATSIDELRAAVDTLSRGVLELLEAVKRLPGA